MNQNYRIKYSVLVIFFSWYSVMYGNTPVKNSNISSVWVFSGHSGINGQKDMFFEKAKAIKSSLKNNYHIKDSNIHLYINKGGNLSKSCVKENVIAAFKEINKLVKNGENCLVIFLGHANSTAKDIHYNLPGRDISMKELSKNINPVKGQGSLGIIWAVESGERAVKMLANKNLVVLASAETEDRDNEPVLNEIFEKLLNKNLVDGNKDGNVSVFELHRLAKKEVKKWYQDRGLIQLEKIILDGDGNGIGTSAPSPMDAKKSKKIILKY